MPFYPKQKLSLDENHRQKGGGQPKPINEDGERCKMVSTNEVIKVLGTNVCIAQTYSPTGASARAQHNCVNGME
jgi:hypothetical protein